MPSCCVIDVCARVDEFPHAFEITVSRSLKQVFAAYFLSVVVSCRLAKTECERFEPTISLDDHGYRFALFELRKVGNTYFGVGQCYAVDLFEDISRSETDRRELLPITTREQPKSFKLTIEWPPFELDPPTEDRAHINVRRYCFARRQLFARLA